MSTGPSLYYDGFVSYDFPKIQFCLMQISDKIESLESTSKKIFWILCFKLKASVFQYIIK